MTKNERPPEIRRWKPGQVCKVSGQYAAMKQRVSRSPFRYDHQITMVEGEVFPPHGEGQVRYVLTDRTRHA